MCIYFIRRFFIEKNHFYKSRNGYSGRLNFFIINYLHIIKNIAKVIPVYGAIVAMIDAANTVTVSTANTTTAKEHAKMAVSDAIREMSDEFRNLLKQKKDLLSRIPNEVPSN